MRMQATATFTIDHVSSEVTATHGDVQHGRTLLTKVFTGGLVGESTVEMSTVIGPHGRGYVAVERIVGRLDGREGSFALLHSAIDDGRRQSARWSIVPGSGQGALSGIRGDATIDVDDDGTHRLALEYHLEPTLG